MRLSEWRAVAPARPSVDPKVLAVVTPVLDALGAGADPHCWVVWGDDVTSRWQILVPTLPGLLVVFVRVNVAGEGPRASAKLVRWARVQVGELAIETQSGHRILSFSVENAILKGVDAEADRVARFALGLVSAVDGRLTDVDAVFAEPARRRGRARPSGSPTKRASATSASTGGAKARTGDAPARRATPAAGTPRSATTTPTRARRSRAG